MTGTGVTCQLYIDGVRVPDGQPTDDPTQPTALAGLGFTWGRSTSLDQPEPSVCTFQLLDLPGGGSFAAQLRTGLPVTVTATGSVYSPPDVSTVVDAGFELTPVGAIPGNLRHGNSTAVVQAAAAPHGHVLELQPIDGVQAHTALLAPDAYSADPAAWDGLVQTAPGQTWQAGIDVMAPLGAAVSIQPVLFLDPAGARTIDVGGAAAAAGTGAWQTLSATLVPTVAGAWVGLRVRVYPTGYSWAQTPGSWVEQVGSWLSFATVQLDNVQVLAPGPTAPRTVLAFAGRITDLAAGWEEGDEAPIIEVTAADFTADLGNVKVGDEPWTRETMAQRFQRVLQLAEDSTGVPIASYIDSTLAGLELAYQDVDAQPVTGLLKDFSQSVDAVLWSAVHQVTGPYLRVEDPATRPSALMLTDDTGSGLVEIVPTASVIGVELSSCDVLRSPVRYVQSVSDVATGATVTWLEEVTDDEGQISTTEHAVNVIDAALEADHGQRRMSLSTLLADPEDATTVAERLMARASFSGWRAGGLTVDETTLTAPDAAAVNLFLQLLDGTARNGMPVLLDDLPPWSPLGPEVTVYLEGASCTFGPAGWEFQLTVSSPQGLGQSVQWAELDPTWSWVDFDPAISWTDLIGVAPEYTPEGI